MSTVKPSQIVAAGYDRIAVSWDQWTETVVPDLRAAALEPILEDIREDARVLDLGCGSGRPVAELLASKYDYVGVDLSPEMIRVARTRAPEAEFEVANMTEIDFASRSFGAVVAFYSIIHVPRQLHSALFRSIRRWLAADGLLVANFVTSDLEAGIEDDWLGSGPMFWSGFGVDQNLALLEDAGFSLDETRVCQQMEGEKEVDFLWVVCRARSPARPPAGSTRR